MGVLLAGVLVSGVLQATPAQAAPSDTSLPSSPVERVSDDPVPVPSGPVPDTTPSTDPVIPSDVEVTRTPEQQQAFDDYRAKSAALDEAEETGKAVEITASTTETSISHAQPDGTVTVETSAGPVRTEVDGDWVPVDTTLEFTADGVQPKAITGDITFSDGDAGAPMAALGDGEEISVQLGWDGDLPRPVLEEDTATYRNVLPAVDLVLTATRQGFTQHLVVNQLPDAATLAALSTLEFPLSSDGATVSEAPGGHLEVREGTDVVGTANAPLMWDARTDPHTGDPAVTAPVGLDLAPPTAADTEATVVLTPPQAFLTDPATVYPVTIDPTQTLGLLGDTFVQNNIANTPQGGSTELRVGSPNGGGQVDRSLLLFDVAPAMNKFVQSAQLSLFENYSYSCTARWVDIRDADWFDPNTVTWNNQPGIGGIVANANVALGYSAGCPANWVNFNMTNWLGQYADERTAYYGPQMSLAVMAGSETDSLAWKKFNSGNAGGNVPTLTFSYDGNCDQWNGLAVCGDIRAKYCPAPGSVEARN
ncbi:exported protein of unknown function [Modestobacter italicus]|uniref:Carbohydrate-binding module family 96 domain-containing protein n=1 Tax=Modestobacter italicus (strain DSM 44449 / CECT 9708 / BC 501) TaxID=2732864 RepID=I4F0W0_MODI5|nr:DNRLRE domain-containing protein [Modestobacter marinus]CCH89273.1 exported protein of unknown function [Modestobacter marinus]